MKKQYITPTCIVAALLTEWLMTTSSLEQTGEFDDNFQDSDNHHTNIWDEEEDDQNSVW